MILTCPACATRFVIDPTALGPQGRKVRCARCGTTWQQFADGSAADVRMAGRADVVGAEAGDGPADPGAAADFRAALAEADGAGADGAGADGAAVERPAAEPEILPPGAALQPAGAETRRRRAAGWGAGWAAFLVLLLAVVAGGYLARFQIVGLWPGAVPVYAALGVDLVAEANGAAGGASGLDLRNVTSEWVPAEGGPALRVRGEVANLSGREQPLPVLRFALYDHDDQLLQAADFPVGAGWLGPDETAPIDVRLRDLDQVAARIEITEAGADRLSPAPGLAEAPAAHGEVPGGPHGDLPEAAHGSAPEATQEAAAGEHGAAAEDAHAAP